MDRDLRARNGVASSGGGGGAAHVDAFTRTNVPGQGLFQRTRQGQGARVVVQDIDAWGGDDTARRALDVAVVGLAQRHWRKWWFCGESVRVDRERDESDFEILD